MTITDASDGACILSDARQQLVTDADESADDLRWRARHLERVIAETASLTRDVSDLVDEGWATVAMYRQLAECLEREARKLTRLPGRLEAGVGMRERMRRIVMSRLTQLRKGWRRRTTGRTGRTNGTNTD